MFVDWKVNLGQTDVQQANITKSLRKEKGGTVQYLVSLLWQLGVPLKIWCKSSPFTVDSTSVIGSI